jgi:hypothetical protein
VESKNGAASFEAKYVFENRMALHAVPTKEQTKNFFGA